jgi:cell division protein FtsW
MAQRLRMDWTLFFTVIGMGFFGLVMVYSASIPKTQVGDRNSLYFLLKQFAVMMAGIAALMVLRRIDYRKLNQPLWAFLPLGLVLSLLLAVYFLDAAHHRWVRVGGFQLQPSEFAKPALAVFLAWFVSRRLNAINSRHTFGPAALALAVLAGLVLAGDLGTMVVLLATAASVFFVAGINRRHFAMACVAMAILAGAGILAKPYRLLRLLFYVDPEQKLIAQYEPLQKLKERAEASLASRDPHYQANQSVIAVGSGGVLGLGLMQGRQKMLYIPEAHTDFIYAVVGEELGLWGCSGVLMGFLIILWRGLRLFWCAHDAFGRYLALGLTTCLVFQAFINISVVLDLGPTKGIPLPLISYGGSSMLSSLISMGLLLSVSERSG